MKGAKKKTNKKYIDLPLEYIGKSVNPSSNSKTPNYYNSINISGVTYEPPLKTLTKLYPSIDPEIVESVFEESCRNISRAKVNLDKLLPVSKPLEFVTEEELFQRDRDIEQIKER